MRHHCWSTNDFCLTSALAAPDEDLASLVYDRVCRTDFRSPGFCLIDLGDISSTPLRQFMVSLKQWMQQIHQSRHQRDLIVLSAGRFDQQETTKLHRDGGPEECFLMLGYEPSQVPASIAMADYSRCAFDMGLSPADLLEKHNPMFHAGEDLLRPYTAEVTCFTPAHAQIVVINNSVAPFSEDDAHWQGVLHTATIHQPDERLIRVVNSMMIASVPLGTKETVNETELQEYINTDVVRRRGYDRQHLEDTGQTA